jgi:hypothetical protein
MKVLLGWYESCGDSVGLLGFVASGALVRGIEGKIDRSRAKSGCKGLECEVLPRVYVNRVLG